MSPHECRQTERLVDLSNQADRIEKEIYVGREGRQPMTVRVASLERIVYFQTYIASALLLAAMLGFGTAVWQTVRAGKQPDNPKTAAIRQYEPADFKN